MKRRTYLLLVGLAFFGLIFTNLVMSEQWLNRAEMLTSRSDAGAVLIGGKIYLIGGRGVNGDLSDTVEEYDLGANTWAKSSVMVRGRWGLSACPLDGKIYAMGGFRATYVALYNILQTYDTVENKWSTKENMPTARYSLSSSVVDGKIYAIGGLVGEAGDYKPTSVVEMYDPLTDTWTKKKSMPTARYGLATTVVNGKIYAIGGATEYDVSISSVATVEEYDPITDTWTQKADMITPRYYLAADAANGLIYAVGGYDINNNVLATVELYVPERNVWLDVMDMPTPRRGLSAVGANGRIYAIGGYGIGDQDLSILEEYTPENWNFAVFPVGKLAVTWGNIKQGW